ncbi:hypothetical protein [Alcanivorax sp.]|uniref:TadE/TadG family type IV pilus assembly protein n=1 Tax=Alcanivorax sp. TaxID=1872427 RepID=UPI000C0D333D|nr:hypothetical protein [Alcanivorax sp.]PHR68104.1 MAG: hypothetical protein COA55_02465 [Alcanivorax sp.]
MVAKKTERGAVALEFLLLFPLIFSLIYAAGVYGVLFSWQVRMQVAVDRSTAAVMALDRSATADPQVAAEALADAAMATMDLAFLGTVPTSAVCSFEAGTPESIVCTLGVPMEGDCPDGMATAGGDAPRQLGFFNGFPPLPDCLMAEARVTF